VSLQEILEESSIHHAEDDSARSYAASCCDSTDGKIALTLLLSVLHLSLQDILEEPSIHHAEGDSTRG
jgi:hypothetical protein